MTTRTAPRTEPDPVFLSVVEAGEFLNTGVRFIRRLTDEKRIAYYKMGGKVRLDKADLIKFAEHGKIEVQR